MFTLIQEEINAAVYDCHQISEILENGIETVTIKEIRDIKALNLCRFGFIMQAYFLCLKDGVEVIPAYMECSTTVYSAVEYCLNLLAKDEEKLVEFVENIKRLKTEVEERNPNAKPLSKIEMFNRVLGVEKPAVNTVNNPEPCSNKGNASGGQRKKSEIEKLREHMKKHKRLCKKCNKYRRHDSRNCPKKPDEIPTDSDSTVELVLVMIIVKTMIVIRFVIQIKGLILLRILRRKESSPATTVADITIANPSEAANVA
ncbi:hypothetical protein Tco_0924920 [Tanacetum coccineum]|uniref:FRIGIDA-like protein n=1 Tax=Tanacetum coccineum TaxID=301880 RepID=A0ABQ5D8E0_9ASTR